MTTLSYTVPVAGSTLNSVADPEVATALTAILTWAAGNIDDTAFTSPVSAVRKLLTQGSAEISAGASSSGDFIFGTAGITQSGTTFGSTFTSLWAADSGLSSQPQDFQVTGRTARARVRATVCVNNVAPAVTLTLGLYAITAAAGTSGNVSLTFGSALAGSTVALAAPAANSITSIESPQFALPTSVGAYALGVNLSGAFTANSGVGISAQLYGYNS